MLGRSLAKKVANRGTYWLGKVLKGSLDHVYVTAYPKSGSTWLSEMLAECYALPFPQHSLFPISFSAIIQNHWLVTPDAERTVYLVRDGRDVAVSAYFSALRHLHKGGAKAFAVKRRYRCFRGLTLSEAGNCQKHLSAFLKDWTERSLGARVSWAEHVREWRGGNRAEVYVRYESLLAQTKEILERVVLKIGDGGVKEDELAWAVERYRFERVAQRERGEEDKGSFHRKGIAGDWTNYFSKGAARVFDRRCGDVLRELGYEQTPDWVSMQ